jgi:peptide/nickel transport system permease protein
VGWLKDIVTLKLGENYINGIEVIDLIKRRGPITAEIAILSLIISWLVGVPVGILSAMKQNTLMDYVARVVTILFIAVPSFWLGALIWLVLLLRFDYIPPPTLFPLWDDPVKNLEIVIWPSLVLGLGISAFTARMARSTLLEIIREDYIRTARAKGLREQVVIVRHALRNAILPVITWSGVLFGIFLGGSVAVERVFVVPGLGTTLVNAFAQRDLVVIQNLVLLYGVTYVLVNLVVDLLYAWVDPRIRYA